jgi:hypothetical protein
MRRANVYRLLLCGGALLVALPFAFGCPGTQDDDPWEDFPGVRIDLEPYRHTEGSGAVARAAGADDLIGGERALGRDGDWYLANDRIRVLVRGPDRAMGPAPWGGSIMSGDIVRPEGEPDRNAFGELSLLLNFGRTLLPEEYRVIYDGSDGGGVVLAVTGRDTLNDFINVPVLLENNLQDAGRLALSPEDDLDLTITQFYVLNPGESRVQVVTAMRNDGDAYRIVTAGELVHSGGNTTFFNPVRPNTHFGYGALPLPEPADDYLAWVNDHVAYGYVPRVDGEPSISMTVSGVTGTIVGAEDMFEFTGRPALQPDELLPLGAVVIAPGGSHVVVRDFYVGRDLAAVHGARLADDGETLGRIEGQVELGGAVPSGTRVAAQNDAGRLVTVFTPRSNGQFSGQLPAGTYRLQVDVPGHPFSEPVDVTVPAGGQASATLNVPAAAEVTVNVRLPDGSPSPAKVTFVCADACPKLLRTVGRDFRDTVGRDPFPTNVMHVGFIGIEGEKTFRVPPGDYHVVVSRGAEYSAWPSGWPADTGEVRTLSAASPTSLEAEIAQVVDTAGWISSDLHVHGINSPDAFVPHRRRVLSFLAEGVDVLVSTDHDFVTDWAPYVAELGADHLMATVIGNEMTTFDWGHFNVFPLEIDPDVRTGSPVDWGNADGPTMTPSQLFDAIAAAPGGAEKVIQVNHPRGLLGHFTAIGLDTATFTTAADPSLFRMDPPTPVGGDTRLFDPRFTAMETYNGWDTGSFVTRTNDWFAFLQRGLKVTATAVSDTHREFSAAVGSPRSWIYMGPGNDDPASFDLDRFVQAINGQKLMGGNGPFIRLHATSNGSSAGLGELLSLSSSTDPVQLDIEIEVPTWFGFDRIEVYANIEGTDARPFSEPSQAPDPTYVIEVDLSEEPTIPGVSVTDDPDSPHRRWRVQRNLEVTPEEDTWYVVMVKGSVSGFPVILEQNVNALAFTNPVYVDVDGDGVFNAPAPIGLAPQGADQIQRPTFLRPGAPRLDLETWKHFMEELSHGH